jgi:WXXGXW repeat (2 copies)
MRKAVLRSILGALLLTAIGIALVPAASAQIGVSITIAPPALPVYDQPLCPGDGYIWTPGYWAWADRGYYWVPGTWILAPEVGYLWTPPWWGWANGGYFFHAGYWGPHVGFYGGISYGFGYFGNGYEGGRWDGGHFFYNRSVTNVNVTVIHNVYNTTVVNRNVNRVSYNGGNGGINARASAEEQRYDNERHVGPVAAQTQHIDAARSNPQFRASENRGKPPVAATARAGEFGGHEAVPAREAGGEYHGGEEHGATNNTAKAPTHAREITPPTRNPIPSTGNQKTDAKYQQEQNKITQRQDQERQKLQQQQEKEDQRNQQRNVAAERQQQTEQRHAQQSQQMQTRHVQEQQHFESSHSAPAQHNNGGGHPK